MIRRLWRISMAKKKKEPRGRGGFDRWGDSVSRDARSLIPKSRFDAWKEQLHVLPCGRPNPAAERGYVEKEATTASPVPVRKFLLDMPARDERIWASLDERIAQLREG